MIREIVKYPEKVLKRKALPVSVIDSEIQTLIDDMIETMYDAPGVGLAAPQVGVSKRIAVIDVSTKGAEMPLLVLINPEILKKEGAVEFEEGCLSLPGFTAKLERSEKLLVRALNREGEQFELESDGLLAIALQHEIDHLDGMLILDRISPIKREFFKKRFQKIQKTGKERVETT
jgi:peptide deformylase